MNTKTFDIEKVQAGDPVVTDDGRQATYIGPHEKNYVFWIARIGYQLYNNWGQLIVGRSLRPSGYNKLVMASKTKQVTVWNRHYFYNNLSGIACAVHTDPANSLLAESRFENTFAKWIAPAYPTTYEIEE